MIASKLHDNFSSPEAIPIWELYDFIKVIKAAGFSGKKHMLYFYNLLVAPFFFVAMVMFAASFSIQFNRYKSSFLSLEIGVLFGFVMYFIYNMLYSIGINTGIPVILVAVIPTLASLLIGLSLILHLEDG
jgi:lipopolysaccharide export system permease protein